MADKMMQAKERTAVAGKKINHRRATDYRTLAEYMGELAVQYPEVELGYIGTSILERPIPVMTIGENKTNRGVLYLGGIHGTDNLTPAVLLRFVNDYVDFLKSGKRMYSVNLPYLFAHRTIHVIPMLNPDGYEIKRHGAVNEVVRERLLRQNGSENFLHWRGNARGVDLWRNFTECEELPSDDEEVCPAGTPGLSPGSEPEVSALANYLRIFDEISMVLSIHTCGDGIRYFTSGKYAARSRTIGRLLSRMTGCMLSDMPANPESGGSLTDWFIREQNKPAFECGCLMNGEVNGNDSEEYIKVYTAFREALFSAPLLI